MTLVYDAYAGALATLDGTTVTVAAFTSSYVPSVLDDDLSALSDEVNAVSATGYIRATVDVSWSKADRALTFDTAPFFDLDGADDVQHFVIADATDVLVCVLSYEDPFEGYDGFEFAPEVLVNAADLAGLEARVAVLEAGVDPAPTGVQSVTGAGVDNTDPANPVITGSGGGGGGSWTVASQIDKSGDASATVAVDLSGLDDTDVSVAILVASTCDTLQMTMPDHARAPLTVVVSGVDECVVEAVGGVSFPATQSATTTTHVTLVPADLGSLSWVAAGAPLEGT